MRERNAFQTGAPATLDDVLRAVLNSSELTRKQCADRASALRTVARLAGRPLGSLSADLRATRKLLTDILPARHCLSAGRWTNVRSLVLNALEIAGIPSRPAHSRVKLSTAWSNLLGPLPYKPYRLCLLPFARFCSHLGIAPSWVTSRTFGAYLAELEKFGLRSHARNSYRSACRAWNAAGRNFENWPKLTVVPDDQRQYYALAWSRFPPSLKADVDDMILAAVNPDPLAGAMYKAIRAPTARGRVRAVRAFASALVHRGVKPEGLKSIADIVEPETAKEGLRFFIEHTGSRQSAYIRDFARLLVTLTRHWVYRSQSKLTDEQMKARDAAIRQLDGIRRALDVPRTGMTPKNRATLRNLQDEEVLDRLLTLPYDVWQRCTDISCLKRSDLIKLQVALAIDILTVAPIRRQNLVGLRFDRNLIINGAGARRRCHLYFPPGDVKNSVEIEFELPAATADLIDRYLREVRPRLAASESPYLFPGNDGSHKCDYLFSNQIASLTAAEVGVRITAHQFRHFAGFFFLKSNPGSYEVVRRLLGHKSINTTLEFYTGMEAIDAFRHYDRLIAERRAQAPASRRQRSGDVAGGARAK